MCIRPDFCVTLVPLRRKGPCSKWLVFVCMLFCHLQIQSEVLTLKPLWCIAFEMLKDGLKGKKSLISSIRMEGYHRLAFTLQHQKAPFFLHMIKSAVDVDLWIKIPLNYYFTFHFRSTTWYTSALPVQFMSHNIFFGLLIILTSQLHMLLISTETVWHGV